MIILYTNQLIGFEKLFLGFSVMLLRVLMELLVVCDFYINWEFEWDSNMSFDVDFL